MFSEDLKRVVLIKKNKPDWQKGFYNGVGGKIEKGEPAHEAMAREFEEETGLSTEPVDWHYFETEMEEDTWEVKFFYCKGNVDACHTMEEEEISVHNTVDIYVLPVIPNLRRLIPKAVIELL